jgi:small-conductance mechanosensitive channel
MRNILQQLDGILIKNSLTEWLVALGVMIAIVFVVAVIKRITIRVLGRVAASTATQLDDALVCVVQATRLWLITVVAVSVSADYLELPPRLVLLFDKTLAIAVFLQLGMWIWAALGFWLRGKRDRALKDDPGAATGLNALMFIARFVLWAILFLTMLANIGVNVTAMVAGLGVGGIAVALAVQNILGDLFASLSIVIDKPFVIGDFVVVGEFQGNVEYVGLKTTRIRSLGGEQIVFSNSDLLKARIRNYKQMRERRVAFTFGVPYQTSVDLVEKIPAQVRAIVEARPKVRFDRAHFKAFGDSSLDFEVVYWMVDPDYGVFMDTQQAINLEMLRTFEAQGVSFAYPTRTLVLDGSLKVERPEREPAAENEETAVRAPTLRVAGGPATQPDAGARHSHK